MVLARTHAAATHDIRRGLVSADRIRLAISAVDSCRLCPSDLRYTIR
jgi:hypothetical protein